MSRSRHAIHYPLAQSVLVLRHCHHPEQLGLALIVRKEEIKKQVAGFAVEHREHVRSEGASVLRRVATLRCVFLMLCAESYKFSALPVVQRLQDVDDFLTTLITDMICREVFLPFELCGWQRPAVTDELTRSLLQLQEGKLGASAILSSAILQDLHTASEGSDILYNQLCGHANRCVSIAQDVMLDYRQLEESKKPSWTEADEHHVQNIGLCHDVVTDKGDKWAKHQIKLQMRTPYSNMLDRPANDDSKWAFELCGLVLPSTELDARCNEYIRDIKILFKYPELKSSRWWIDNPVACSTMMYNMALEKESAGICFANNHPTILFAAYIYAALLAQGTFKGSKRWAAMDDIIAVHGKDIFFGALPSDLNKLWKAWQMRTGQVGSAQSKVKGFVVQAKGGDRTGKLPFKQAQTSCLSMSDTAHALTQWYYGKESMIRIVYAVHGDMTKAQRAGASKVKHEDLNALDFVETFAEHIHKDCARMSIDYVGLTNTCHRLLAALDNEWRTNIRSKLSRPRAVFNKQIETKHFPNEKHSAGSWRPAFNLVAKLIYQAAMWFGQTDEVKKLRKAGHEPGPCHMIAVGSFVKGYLEKNGMLAEVSEMQQHEEPLKKRYGGRAVTSAQMDAIAGIPAQLRKQFAAKDVKAPEPTAKEKELAALLEAVDKEYMEDLRKGGAAAMEKHNKLVAEFGEWDEKLHNEALQAMQQDKKLNASAEESVMGFDKKFMKDLRGKWPA